MGTSDLKRPHGRESRKSGGFLPFEQARDYARSLGLSSQQQWEEWCGSGRRPHNIPARPDHVYRDLGWAGIADWVGKSEQVHGFLPFEEAREYARSLGLKGNRQWRESCRSGQRPAHIPAAPNQVYRHSGWAGWRDWLANETQGHGPGRKFLPFEQARAYAKSLGLTRSQDWRKWCASGQRPPNIPADPSTYYVGRGWAGWPDWLGTDGEGQLFLPFEQAREYARLLGLKSNRQWREWSSSGQRPANIPAHPDQIYKHSGWSGWRDWLANESAGRGPGRKFLPFEQARSYARSLGMHRYLEWYEWSRSGQRPANIPAHPDHLYRDSGWVGWPDWLGIGTGPGGYRRGVEWSGNVTAWSELLAPIQRHFW